MRGDERDPRSPRNPSRPAEQQGDGQPENRHELEDPAGGAAHDAADREANADDQGDGGSAPTRIPRGTDEHQPF